MDLAAALTVAASDSGGGAGIQADLKTFHVLGVHGTCAVTSVTAQNTRGVAERFDLPAGMVASQMRAVLSDLGVGAVKTGMLANASIVEAVAETLAAFGVERLVVDPVICSSSGYPLLDAGGLQAMVERLLPLTTVFTPNLAEAEAILARGVRDLEGMKEAARNLRELGPRCVVVKGGHLESGEATDVLFDGGEPEVLSQPRVETANDHGTGCVFSAAVAAALCRGEAPREAVLLAKKVVSAALRNALDLGGGAGPVCPPCGVLEGLTE
jgi:hydroxymethylpyrimidine/phosphomethylpyrimidine kinase